MPELQTEVELFPASAEYPRFSDLQLAREPDGRISFSRDAMEHVCRALGRPLHTLSDDDLAALITVHYVWHLLAGGDPVPLLEGLIQ